MPGIYQLRGFDLSVMSVIEGDDGVIVVDPLISTETATAAFALYREHRGDRPVRAVIYTHSHVDHFGGVKGIIGQEAVEAGDVAVIAREGFMEHAVAENVFAGTAMARRAGYMYGAAVEKGPAGQVGAGLGQSTSTGDVTLIAPTVDISSTGQELTVVAEEAYRAGDYRWAVEVLDHVLFADEADDRARALQADAMEQLAFGAENGTWRNAYLAGATELRRGRFGTPTSISQDLLAALSVAQVFDSIAIRIDGPRAWDHHIVLSWVFTDTGATHITELRNGALNHRLAPEPTPGTRLTLTRAALISLVTGTLDLDRAAAEGVMAITGDPDDLHLLMSLVGPVDPDFAIVTP